MQNPDAAAVLLPFYGHPEVIKVTKMAIRSASSTLPVLLKACPAVPELIEEWVAVGVTANQVDLFLEVAPAFGVSDPLQKIFESLTTPVPTFEETIVLRLIVSKGFPLPDHLVAHAIQSDMFEFKDFPGDTWSQEALTMALSIMTQRKLIKFLKTKPLTPGVLFRLYDLEKCVESASTTEEDFFFFLDYFHSAARPSVLDKDGLEWLVVSSSTTLGCATAVAAYDRCPMSSGSPPEWYPTRVACSDLNPAAIATILLLGGNISGTIQWNGFLHHQHIARTFSHALIMFFEFPGIKLMLGTPGHEKTKAFANYLLVCALAKTLLRRLESFPERAMLALHLPTSDLEAFLKMAAAAEGEGEEGPLGPQPLDSSILCEPLADDDIGFSPIEMAINTGRLEAFRLLWPFAQNPPERLWIGAGGGSSPAMMEAVLATAPHRTEDVKEAIIAAMRSDSARVLETIIKVKDIPLDYLIAGESLGSWAWTSRADKCVYMLMQRGCTGETTIRTLAALPPQERSQVLLAGTFMESKDVAFQAMEKQERRAKMSAFVTPIVAHRGVLGGAFANNALDGELLKTIFEMAKLYIK